MTQPRIRITNALLPSSGLSRDYSNTGVLQSSSVIQSGRYKSGTYKSIVDYPVKGYARRRAEGEVILNPVIITSQERSCIESNWTFGPHPVWGSRVMSGSLACEAHLKPDEVVGFESDLLQAKAQALVEAYAKMNSPDVLLSVFYAERGKTLDMVRRPFSRTAELLESVIARKATLVRRGLTVAQAFAQAWLEYRYGWRDRKSVV